MIFDTTIAKLSQLLKIQILVSIFYQCSIFDKDIYLFLLDNALGHSVDYSMYT